MNNAENLIKAALQSRRAEGFSHEHDDNLVFGELPRVALCLLRGNPVLNLNDENGKLVPMQVWPDTVASFPANGDRVNNLIVAGASILAERERLNRLESQILSQLETLLKS